MTDVAHKDLLGSIALKEFPTKEGRDKDLPDLVQVLSVPRSELMAFVRRESRDESYWRPVDAEDGEEDDGGDSGGEGRAEPGGKGGGGVDFRDSVGEKACKVAMVLGGEGGEGGRALACAGSRRSEERDDG